MHNILIFGSIMSIVFYEITEISPGGIIVPAYVALYLDSPEKVAFTIGNSLLIVAIVRFLSPFLIVYGRRKFVFCIVLSFLLRFLFQRLHLYLIEEQGIYLFSAGVIGTLISGILAQEMSRHGIWKTLSAMIILSIFIKAALSLFYKLGGIL